jgi:hypothetical protein
VRLAHDGRELARAVVEDVAFPEFLAAYRDLARALAQAGAMALAAARDRAALISARDELERERDLLRGLLPICSSCKKVRDDKDHWTQVEAYVASRSHATFTHGICPECIARLYPDYVKD